jgi:hypothetical protein
MSTGSRPHHGTQRSISIALFLLHFDFMLFHFNIKVPRNLPPLIICTYRINREPHSSITTSLACSLAITIRSNGR